MSTTYVTIGTDMARSWQQGPSEALAGAAAGASLSGSRACAVQVKKLKKLKVSQD